MLDPTITTFYHIIRECKITCNEAEKKFNLAQELALEYVLKKDTGLKVGDVIEYEYREGVWRKGKINRLLAWKSIATPTYLRLSNIVLEITCINKDGSKGPIRNVLPDAYRPEGDR